jgi:hypothetical protein
MAMTAFPDAAAAGRRQARLMKIVNVPMRAVLSLPFPTPLSANLMLVSYTGVKSGKSYRQPVSHAPDGDTLLTPGGGRWTLNLKGGREVTLRLRGRPRRARADLISDPAEVARLLDVIAAGNPRAMGFIPIPRRADGRLDPDAVAAAVGHGFRIVRWHLASLPGAVSARGGRRGAGGAGRAARGGPGYASLMA